MSDFWFQKRANMIDASGVETLADAADDVAYLVDQDGMSPTRAVAKVASAAHLSGDQLKLLVYTYNNLGAAEKRASAGNALAKLADYKLANYADAYRLVFGGQAAADTESAAPSGAHTKRASFDVSVFKTDIADTPLSVVDRMLGIAGNTKTASEDDSGDSDKEHDPDCVCPCCIEDGEHKPKKLTRITISITGSGDMNPHKMFDKMPEHVKSMIPAEILRMFESKSAEYSVARAEADDEYAHIADMVGELAHDINNTHSPEPAHYKAAGLAAIHELYPSVSALLPAVIKEIPARLLKEAAYTLNVCDVTSSHPYIAAAKQIDTQLTKVADLTAKAQRLGCERRAIRDFFNEYDRIQKTALFSMMESRLDLSDQEQVPEKKNNTKIASAATLFLSNLASRGLIAGTSALASQGLQQSGLNEDGDTVKNNLFQSLDNRLHESNLRDIEIQSLINDLSVNDDVLHKFPREDIVATFNDLYRTAPLMMRNPVQARLFLRQYMTQGSMAPTEIMPALQMNKMVDNRKRLSEEV
jgi:hypothetical protein